MRSGSARVTGFGPSAASCSALSVRQESATLIETSTGYLSTCDAVVLVDVSALDLDAALLDPAHSPLVSYVDGGRLLVIGDPDSYGVGGYTGTALDDVLPVSMKLPRRKDTPSVAVALIIEDLETQSNVNTSKVAGEGVIKLLTPAGRVAVNDGSGTDAPAAAGRCRCSTMQNIARWSGGRSVCNIARRPSHVATRGARRLSSDQRTPALRASLDAAPGAAPIRGPQDRAAVAHGHAGAGARAGHANQVISRAAGLAAPGAAPVRAPQDRAIACVRGPQDHAS
jgi:hypothetical protein